MEHLAIIDKHTMDIILNGTKFIESRFSKNKITPYNTVKVRDTVYLKESGKDISAKFTVKDVLYFSNLNKDEMKKIINKYGSLVNAPNEYWNIKMDSIYGTLIYISNTEVITPIKINKKDRRGFISFNNIKDLEDIVSNNINKNKCDCNNNKHLLEVGDNYLYCVHCNKNIIDRNILKELPDYNIVFKELNKSHWCNDWFNFKLDKKAEDSLRDININRIRKRIINSILKYNKKRDGKQTPFTGDAIYYAQHATGTCCRKCLEMWYSIPKERDLTDKELDYFTNIIMNFIVLNYKINVL